MVAQLSGKVLGTLPILSKVELRPLLWRAQQPAKVSPPRALSSMASVPDQSGADQVQFDFQAASSLVDDILAVPATASAVMNEASDGSTATVPSAQSPAGSTGLSPIPEHDAGQHPLTTPLPTTPDLPPAQVANKETFRTPQHHPEETPRASSADFGITHPRTWSASLGHE